MIWMLNLVPKAVVDAAISEAARVLRPGGLLVATVDKELSHDAAATDLSDGLDRVTGLAAGAGLEPAGVRTFTARTQWLGPADGQVFRLAGFRKPG